MQSSTPINTAKVARTLFVVALFTVVFLQLDASHFNGIEAADDASTRDRAFHRLYFVASTLSTVGYGDVTPKSRQCKQLVTGMILAMLTVLAS